jgi:uncharacterized protein (DUF362 family)
MKRREFVKKTSQAVALAAVTAGVGIGFYNRDSIRYAPVRTLTTDFTVPPEPTLPGLAMAYNPDPSVALRQALDAVGGIKRFVAPGEKVTIKPNVGWDRTPAQAANTNPELVAEMVSQCLSAGAREVVVSDVTCNDARRCFLRSGIREAAEKAGAHVALASEEDYILADLGGQLLTSWPVLKHFVDTDRLINMPIVKHHSLSGCTIGMKNLYGIIGGRRNQLHQKIDQSIVDLATFARPTLTVVDATHVLMRGGPQGGSLDDVEQPNCVLCSTDQVAADARAVEFLGRTADQIGHIVLADQSGLGQLDYAALGLKEIR